MALLGPLSDLFSFLGKDSTKYIYLLTMKADISIQRLIILFCYYYKYYQTFSQAGLALPNIYIESLL